jgi:hypothetical protein
LSKRIGFGAPHYVVFFNFLSLHHFFGANILVSILFSNTLKFVFFLNARDQVSHPHNTTGRTEEKSSELNVSKYYANVILP